MLGTLTIPYVFFPIIAGSPLGILTKIFGVNAFFQTYVAVACLGGSQYIKHQYIFNLF